MNKIIKMSVLASAFALAGSASAATTTLTGSDTMDQLTVDEINSCGPPATNMTYTGGGSGTGENNMRLGKQQTAPMSRKLQASNTCRSATPASAQCKAVALDGIAIVMPPVNNPGTCSPSGSGTSCAGTTSCGVQSELDAPNNTFNVFAGGVTTTTPTGTYTLNSQFDALRIIYAGMDQNASNVIGNKNCSSDLRKSLINQWGKIFTPACTAGTCTKLTHAYRRGDASGTTDTFLTLLGLTAPIPTVPVANQTNTMPVPFPTNPFCNGWEREDADPVRATCGSNGDTVCNVTAGVVLPIVVPEQLTVAAAYPTKVCTSGKFDLKPARRTLLSGGAQIFECPEGSFPAGKNAWSGSTYNIGGLCYTPYFLNGTAHEYDCLNTRANKTPAGLDGLSENRFLRNITSGALVNDSAGAVVGNGFYRMRNAACQLATATTDIGCLVSNVACSMGYSGREAADTAIPAAPAAVHQILPTVANIQALVQNPPPVAIYPISRTLNLCSLVGLSHVTDTNEAALSTCYQDPTITNPNIDKDGFVELPTTGSPVTCFDFDETSCNTVAVTCATNADCGVFPCVGTSCDFSCAAKGGDTYCAGLQPGSTCIADHCGFATSSATCP